MQANPHFQPGAPPDDGTALAIEAWNLMGGELNWAALPLVAAFYGIEDVEMLVRRLAAIRDHQQRLAAMH